VARTVRIKEELNVNDAEPRVGPAPEGPTGQPRVDAALAELDRIVALPPEQQVAGYTEVHAELQATLAALDEGR
jgi:hypothetical protein